WLQPADPGRSSTSRPHSHGSRFESHGPRAAGLRRRQRGAHAERPARAAGRYRGGGMSTELRAGTWQRVLAADRSLLMAVRRWHRPLVTRAMRTATSLGDAHTWV